MEKWVYPEDGYWGTDYSEYYVVYMTHRDADIYVNVNYDYLVRELEAKQRPDEECSYSDEGYLGDCLDEYHSCSFVGWRKYLFIHESCKELLEKAEEILERLEDEMTLDEDDYYNRRYVSMIEYWKSISEEDRCELIREANDEVRADYKWRKEFGDENPREFFETYIIKKNSCKDLYTIPQQVLQGFEESDMFI